MRAAARRLARPSPRSAVLGAAVCLAVLVAWLLGAWEVAELKILDRHLRFRGPLKHPGDVIIVGISEQTFDALGHPWPFPRALTARLIEMIAAGRPAAIGVDLLFTEPSLFGPEDDAALASALRKYGNVVLAAFSFQEVETLPVGRKGVVERRTYQALRLPVEPLPRASVGFVNVFYDADGFVRRVPLFVEFRAAGRFESLAGQLVKVGSRSSRSVPPSTREMMINFRGPAQSFETMGFERVFRGEVDPQRFAGKIVLIGTTSPVLHDVAHTPFAPRAPIPGVEIHANAVDNLLRSDPLRAAGGLPSLLLALLAAGAGTVLGSRVAPPRSFLLVAAIGLGILGGAHAALVWFRLWIEQVPIHLALFGTYFAMLVAGAPFRLPAPPPPPASPET